MRKISTMMLLGTPILFLDFCAFKNSQLTAKKFESIHGVAPSEDMCGIEVYEDDCHVTAEVKLDNCCSSATHIFNGGWNSYIEPLHTNFFYP